jgi:hypothetical protein
MGRRFLSATHQQVRATCALGILFLAIVFWPTIRWLPQMLTRVNPVRAGQVEVEVPRGWVVRKETSRVQAAKPCLTVFCSQPSGSIAVSTVDEPDLDETTWRKSAEAVLQKFDFPSPRLRQIAGDSGVSKCLEAKRDGASKRSDEHLLESEVQDSRRFEARLPI